MTLGAKALMPFQQYYLQNITEKGFILKTNNRLINADIYLLWLSVMMNPLLAFIWQSFASDIVESS